MAARAPKHVEWRAWAPALVGAACCLATLVALLLARKWWLWPLGPSLAMLLHTVVGVGLWRWSDEETLDGVSEQVAANWVSVWMHGLHEHRFGFPSGVFEVKETVEQHEIRVVAKEKILWHSFVQDAIAQTAYGAQTSLWWVLLGAMVTVCLLPLAVAELIGKLGLASSVSCRCVQTNKGTTLTMKARGPGAWLVKTRMLRALGAEATL